MYNIFRKQIYIKHYNIIRASHGKLTSLMKSPSPLITLHIIIQVLPLEHHQQPLQIFACLESEQCILPFTYLLFQIHFPTDCLSHSLSHLNMISSFTLYYFVIIIYSSYIHSQQLYFSIKSVIFTTFFAILSQESNQNLM